MRYRYYITNLLEGDIKGTDNPEIANQFAESDDYAVLDSETGEGLLLPGISYIIMPIESSHEAH